MLPNPHSLLSKQSEIEIEKCSEHKNYKNTNMCKKVQKSKVLFVLSLSPLTGVLRNWLMSELVRTNRKLQIKISKASVFIILPGYEFIVLKN